MIINVIIGSNLLYNAYRDSTCISDPDLMNLFYSFLIVFIVLTRAFLRVSMLYLSTYPYHLSFLPILTHIEP